MVRLRPRVIILRLLPISVPVVAKDFGMKLGCFILALFAVFTVSCTACNGGGDGASNGTADLPELELRLPLDTDVPTLDPAHMVDVTSFGVASQIFGRLVRFDENVKLENEMAESYQVSPDGNCQIRYWPRLISP